MFSRGERYAGKVQRGVPEVRLQTEDRDDRADVGAMERNQKQSENRLAEILGIAALVVLALVTVIYLLGV